MTIEKYNCNCSSCIHRDCCKYREILKNFLNDEKITLKLDKEFDEFFILTYRCKYFKLCEVSTNTISLYNSPTPLIATDPIPLLEKITYNGVDVTAKQK